MHRTALMQLCEFTSVHCFQQFIFVVKSSSNGSGMYHSSRTKQFIGKRIEQMRVSEMGRSMDLVDGEANEAVVGFPH